MNTLNKALRLLRVFNDKTLSRLAGELDISIGYLSEIESNKKNPSLDIIKRYAKVFKTKESSILFFAERLDNQNSFKNSMKNNLINFLETIEKMEINEKKTISNRKKSAL
ncbi:MAG: helix-turn-helix domain-containing protein [Elusimicrobia bacterium]|nr:helix-turn-helix domain-containing protein [Elusimicrobiota bacterium]